MDLAGPQFQSSFSTNSTSFRPLGMFRSHSLPSLHSKQLGFLKTPIHPRTICTCPRSLQNPNMCVYAEKMVKYIKRSPEDEECLKRSYGIISGKPRNVDEEIQVMKDCTRTYPELMVYQDASCPDTERLARLLNSLAIHFPDLGYIQGMNIVMASLFYHIQSEHLTFWMFCYLLNYLNMEEIYKKGSSWKLTQRTARTAPPQRTTQHSHEEEARRRARVFRGAHDHT